MYVEGEDNNKKEDGTDGLLRLHSTYRHDLKCYTSDEGRCQKTAAAFLKGLLYLEGALAPVLAIMVRNDEAAQKMLNDSSEAEPILEKVKQQIEELFHSEEPILQKFSTMFQEEPTIKMKAYLTEIGTPLPKLK